MHILVTGGAGYIGSHTARHLLDLGHTITIIDNLSTGNREAVPVEAQFHQMDLSDSARVRALLSSNKFDAVIHFAASTLVPESIKNPQKYFTNNTANTSELAQLILEFKVPYFIFSSTAAVYGEPTINPVVEDMELAPINPYGESKMQAEAFIRKAYSSQSECKYTILRYFNVAGAQTDGSNGQNHAEATNLFKNISQVACGEKEQLPIFGADYPTPDGTCIRDYIHVEDIAQAHLAAVNYLSSGGKSEIMNVGYGHGFSVKEIVKSYEKANHIELPTCIKEGRKGDPAEVIADNSKITSLTDWTPHYDDIELICKTAFLWEKHLLAQNKG